MLDSALPFYSVPLLSICMSSPHVGCHTPRMLRMLVANIHTRLAILLTPHELLRSNRAKLAGIRLQIHRFIISKDHIQRQFLPQVLSTAILFWRLHTKHSASAAFDSGSHCHHSRTWLLHRVPTRFTLLSDDLRRCIRCLTYIFLGPHINLDYRCKRWLTLQF